MVFICYKNCSTCKKVQNLMEEKSLDFEIRDIKEDKPTREELEMWQEKSNLPIDKFYNTSGSLYRQLNLKEKRKEMSLEEQFELLSKDGMLVKRPILLDGEKVLVGPLVKKYVESL